MGEYSNRKCTCNSVTDKKMQKEDNKVEATIGVFFDGTCNNKYNSMYTPHNRSSTNGFAKAGKRKVRIGDDCDGSYEGDLTNIAKLWETYTSSKEKRIDRVYIEGPGTEAPVKDMKSPYLTKMTLQRVLPMELRTLVYLQNWKGRASWLPQKQQC